MKAIILAAGTGIRLGDLTKDKPKCLLEIGKTTILGRTTSILRDYGINDITIVVGAKGDVWNKETYAKIKEMVPYPDIKFHTLRKGLKIIKEQMTVAKDPNVKAKIPD